MIRVFTKYDILVNKVIEPSFREIGVVELTPGTRIDESTLELDYVDHPIARIEEGLEGVRFVHYE